MPSRHQVQEYRDLKESLDREVGRINGNHGRPGWVPIHYQYRALDRNALVAQYLAAQAALVTPLKDGMNLVAPEFVACRSDELGVLVLSEFAGVARQLDGALIVNPYDLDGCAIAIEQALTDGSRGATAADGEDAGAGARQHRLRLGRALPRNEGRTVHRSRSRGRSIVPNPANSLT